MPMGLLRRLAESQMPATVTESGDVMQLRILQAAGHIYAEVPLPRAEQWQWRQDAATVYQVTPLGYKVLRWFGPPGGAIEKDHEK
jgi:hypothetical protein